MIDSSHGGATVAEATGTLIFDADNAALSAVSVFLLSLQGFAYTVEVYNSGEEAAKIWADDDYAEFSGAVCGLSLRWAPNRNIRHMAKNLWPNQIAFETCPYIGGIPSQKAILGVAGSFLAAQSQYMIASVYENYIHFIRREYGTKDSGWPDCWRIGKLVRDSLSHRGTIDIKSDDVYIWRSLSLNKENNKYNLLHKYFFEEDIIVLLHDMSRFIDKSWLRAAL